MTEEIKILNKVIELNKAKKIGPAPFSLENRVQKPKNIIEIKKENKNIAKVSNSFLESFIKNNNTTGLKLLFYIAKGFIKTDAEDTDLITLSINAKECLTYCKINIQTLQKNITRLTETSIKIKGEKSTEYFNLIPYAKFHYTNSTIEVKIFAKILRLANALERYSIIDCSYIMALKSQHSIRMLMLLERISNYTENIPKRQNYELEELNLMFDTKYEDLQQFARRVLEPAKQELDKNSTKSFIYILQKDKISYNVGRSKNVSITIDLIKNKPSLLLV